MKFAELIIFIFSFQLISCNGVSVSEVLSVNIDSPAVTTFVNAGVLDPENPVVLATSFSTSASDNFIIMLKDFVFTTPSATIVSVDDDVLWPNQADPVDNNVIINQPAGIIGAGGFFVSVPFGQSFSTGSVDLYFQNSSSASFSKTQISTDKTGYFYHEASFIDVNGDGISDVMGARCYVPKFGGSRKSELVVMTQPTDGSDEWDSTVVFNNGPDVSFVIVDLDNDGNNQVIATEYFVNQRLALYSCTNGDWINCADGNGVTNLVIDDSEGTMFNIFQVDLNGDGVKDFLVTSQGDSGKGKVLAYELPSEGWSTPDAVWPKHELADGYAPLKPFPGSGSPGTAVSFPSPIGGVKPWIVVSADDGGWVDLLVPTTDDQVDDWSYNKTRIVQSDGTVGTPAIGDLDNDGIPELIVPLYNENRIAVYTFNL